MTENLGRKTTLVVVVTLLALASILYFPLVLGKPPFRLGLDLQGGTRMVFRFDFDAAVQAGSITREELNDKALLLQETADIIRGRVDPKGVMELSLRTEGEDRLVIELPGAAAVSGVQVNSKLAKPLSADSTADDGRQIELDPTNNSGKNEEIRAINSFPADGGELRIGEEKILYSRRVNNVLYVSQRADSGTTIAAHPAGAVVELLTTDDLIKKIKNVGDMQFFLAALSSDFTALGTDEQTERKKVEDWQAANPNAPIEDFNRLPKDKGGPPEGLLWYPHRPGADELVDPNVKRPLTPLVVPRPTDPTEGRDAWVFTGKDLAMVGYDTDPQTGYPAVHFETTTEKRTAFGEFTGTNIDRGMAIVMNGEIITLATINGRLPGSGIITGGGRGFTPKEVNDLISVLRSGSLRLKPILLDTSRVGASLGDAYVVNALYSTIAALGLILAFMIFFYRRLGMYSVVGLLINIVVLMGTLAFLQATLTLPGVAGIILTLGMAVDGNILIFERLREEMARGLKLIQAVKAAFERAAVAIIDSNVTTLIAGVILYFVGTGAIRGFATTLNIGILSTLFTVIVVSQVLVLADVKRGRKSYSMIKVLEKPKIKFMNASRIAIPISLITLFAGVALFAWLPDHKKLGIDFLGGFAVTVRTQEPQQEQTIRDLVAKIPGTIGESAQIQAITDSGSKDRGYSTWRITFKLQGEETTSDADIGERGLKEIQDALEPVLQRGPVEVKLEPGEGVQKVQGELYLEDSHTQEDIAKALASGKVRNAVLAPLPGDAKGFTFTGETEPEISEQELVSAVTQAFTGFKDSRSVAYRLMTPIPESTFVGAQVGGELRDRAVRALLLGMLGSILYLRIRFAEYSFGIGVVAAVAHDVLIALGGLAVACWTGILQAELDLTMIAAFLTIIGYSQNDTIVIFDRVRENLPKSKKPLREILDDSINETLGRTILTTCTVFLTLLVLFLFNVGSRNVLEGFSFCMLVGVVSGCYSTIYIASPVLLWFDKMAKKREQKSNDNTPKDTPAAVSS
jgi:SecD/SecF fusion protein